MAYKKGATVEMIALVRDIDDGNEVVFQLWREGQDPNSGIPVGVVRATIKDGMAKAKCCLQFPDSTLDFPLKNGQKVKLMINHRRGNHDETKKNVHKGVQRIGCCSVPQ